MNPEELFDVQGGAAVRILKEGVSAKLNGVEIGNSVAAVRGEAVAEMEMIRMRAGVDAEFHGNLVVFRKAAGDSLYILKDDVATLHAKFFPVTTAAASELANFKNFHRSLCARFGYTHDDQDWLRDLVSLEEHIAAKVSPRAADAPSGPNDDYKLIAHLIGIIFMAGDFVAETANERQLEQLLIKTGHRYKNWAEVDELNERAADALDSQPTEAQPGIIYLVKGNKGGWWVSTKDAYDNAADWDRKITYENGCSQPAASSSQESNVAAQLYGNAMKAARSWARVEHLNAKNLGAGGPGQEDDVDRAETAFRTALDAMFDSRAPAAQAASVAPDGFVLEGYYRKNGKHFDRLKSRPNDCTLSSGWVAHYVPSPQQEGSEAGK